MIDISCTHGRDDFEAGTFRRHCRNPACSHHGKSVTPLVCGQCGDRREPLRSPMPPAPDPAAYTPGRPRPDLQAIELTLPPADQEQRTFTRPVFEPDGAITYPMRDGDWEPPRDISGYVRDPHNPWRFLPLWLPCALRLPQGFHQGACGCIGLNMRCNQPLGPTFGQQVPYTTCRECPQRS